MVGNGQTGGGITAFLPFLLILFVIYFLMIRPQAKRQREKKKMLTALKKGNKVVTVGGIHGTIAGFKNKDRNVVLRVDKKVELTVNRSAIAGMSDSVTAEETTALEQQG